MTDDEIRAEIARQVHDAFALLATKLLERAQHNGPVIATARNLTADEMDHLP